MDVMFFVFLGMLCSCQINGYSYGMNKNKRQILVRRAVLEDYDKVIGPVKYIKNDYLTVEFQLVVLKLVEVNTKAETIKIDGWVKQKWLDGIMKWKPSELKNTSHTRFSSDEIWVPDVALLNNADPHEKLSGGPTKFITNVHCNYEGKCTWISPATFTSSCRMNVRYWPMDTQVCTLTFGSWTFRYKNLRIVPLDFSYEKGSISNGEWTINDIEAHTSKVRRAKTYSILNLQLTLTRKPTYVLFYLTPPAIILVVLALLSFFIPTYSGERIGFVTTILLAKMVFLLMMPEYLPKTSDQLPILGILLILSMVMVAAVLTSTIFILACHHREGKPSMLTQKLFFPFKFLVKKHPFKTNKDGILNRGMKTIQKMLTSSCKFLAKKQSFTLDRDTDGVINQGMETELQEADTKDVVTIAGNDLADPGSVQEEEVTWQDIAKKLNSFAFFVIMTALLLTGLAVSVAY